VTSSARTRPSSAQRAGSPTRKFSRFSQALEEVVNARVYSGIHFRTGDVAGARIGQQVARWREQHYFRSASCR
jgi:hypothetical protein